jgi:hypothetical protein
MSLDITKQDNQEPMLLKPRQIIIDLDFLESIKSGLNSTHPCMKPIFDEDVLSLLEMGRQTTKIMWLDENGIPVNMFIEIQKLMDPDSWIDEELTEEEKKSFDTIDGKDFIKW